MIEHSTLRMSVFAMILLAKSVYCTFRTLWDMTWKDLNKARKCSYHITRINVWHVGHSWYIKHFRLYQCVTLQTWDLGEQHPVHPTAQPRGRPWTPHLHTRHEQIRWHGTLLLNIYFINNRHHYEHKFLVFDKIRFSEVIVFAKHLFFKTKSKWNLLITRNFYWKQKVHV